MHRGGPLLVVAGAGSGKTRVLTHRIAHLIKDEGVSPFEILAITFTNKAADEMKQRVAALVGSVAQKMWVSTFHSACVRILRRDAAALGFPSSFTIYDQADAVRLTGYVIRDLNLDPKRFPPRSVHGMISAAKNDDVGPAEYAVRRPARCRDASVIPIDTPGLSFGRVHDNLRISVTDRCNLRCTYCMPEDVTFRDRAEGVKQGPAC